VITFRRAALGGLALVASGAMLAACAAPPAPESSDGPSAAPASDFLPCMVSDAGGFDDKSFNQLGAEGIEEAAAELGVEPILVESASDADYGPNIQNLIDQGCTMVVTIGFALSAATVEAALANPDIEFAIVDDAADNDFDGQTDAPNIKPLLFDTAEAAFLAGYAAASYSTSGVVGTFGGAPFPTVSIFMDGFAQGVAYYNEANGANVTVLGWDTAAQDGSFVSSDPAIAFQPGPLPLQIAQGFIDQGADVIFPVGGPIYQSAVAAIESSGKEIPILGVDADVYETDPSVASYLLTSVRKLIDVAVYDAVIAAGNGEFDSEPYVGTLENQGVGIAPFHDYEDKVKPGLADELQAIAEQIVAGEITVSSYLK